MNAKKYDLVVAGGGMAGVAAAISAAREGLSVLIVEKQGFFGGAMNSALVYPFMSFWTVKDGKVQRLLSGGLLTEMRERAWKKEHGEDAPFGIGTAPDNEEEFNRLRNFSNEMIKLALDDMINEAGVDVLFHSTVYAVDCADRRVKSISVASKSGSITLEADFFIDATGDGEVMTLAGCEFLLGREGDNLTQPMTTCFRVCNVDLELYKKELHDLQALYRSHREQGLIKNPRENLLQFYGLGDGIVHYNTTRVVKIDPTDPFALSKAEMEARSQVLEVFNFLREHSAAYKNAVLVSVAAEIGIRESRKLVGEHVITEQELFDKVHYEDSIALGNYDVDIHSPDGTGTYIRKFDRSEYYYVPYRSLLPKEYDNLLVAGRCLSATHSAHSSVRIMPICASLGEAAGVAVSLAKKNGQNTHTVNIPMLQQRLRELGAEID